MFIENLDMKWSNMKYIAKTGVFWFCFLLKGFHLLLVSISYARPDSAKYLTV